MGFTKKTAQDFFEVLTSSGIKRVIDSRLNNSSQLAGFTKHKDLEYFLKKIGNIDYLHLRELAPTKELLNEYKKNGGNWEKYEQQFLKLMSDRQVEKKVSPELLNKSCLLCSEATAEYCHRRLVAEYLNRKLGNIEIHHL
ncbi:MAG: DUF488 domain-containing protein [Microcoleaceae cyanobacterium MO_207.B10]|nr:DUF488 domain-containing protein [Microcoleaceae cyanobacterium MO_207.B10]